MKKLGILIFLATFIMPSMVNAQGCAEPSSEEGVQIFGYVQSQFDVNFNDETQSTFKFNRARIGAMGNIPYDFSYYVLLETSPYKKGNPYLLDAFITYSRFKNARISVGSFKSPFGLELGTACQGLHTINRSMVVSQLASPDRDLGLMIMGGSDETKLTYALALLNGTGLLVTDDNSSKDIAGRFTYKPLKGVRVGTSFRYGKAVPAVDGTDDDTRSRWGAELEVAKGNFLFQGEYIYGKDDGSYTTGGGCGDELEVHQGSVKRDGFFAQAMYMTKWNLQPVIKFESYDADKDLDNNLEQITTFGLNYFFNDWTRFQVNYVYAAEQAKEINNDMLMLQLQVKF